MPMRIVVLLFCLAASNAAWADARAQLHAAFVKFLAQSSFEARTQATVAGRALQSVVEFQAPDRYRLTSAGRPPAVIIGSTMYLTMNGHAMKMPAAAASIAQFRDADRLAQVERSATVDDLGADVVGGVPAHKYRYRATGATPADCEVWVGVASGLPLQLRATSQGKAAVQSLVTYSRYGDPAIRVDAPK